MKKLLIILTLVAVGYIPGYAQVSATDIARRYVDSLIRPKRPITALEQRAVDSVILDAIEAGGGFEAYLRSLPGFGNNKMLSIQADALIWVTGTVGTLLTYLATNDGFYLTTTDGFILTPAE